MQAADELGLRVFLDPKCRISAEHEGVDAEREGCSQRVQLDDRAPNEDLKWSREVLRNASPLSLCIFDRAALSESLATQQNWRVLLAYQNESKYKDQGIQCAHDPKYPRVV